MLPVGEAAAFAVNTGKQEVKGMEEAYKALYPLGRFIVRIKLVVDR